jgi:peptidyl-prolyl cis-trans isomerase C
MKSLQLFFLVTPVACLLAQTPAQTPPPSASSQPAAKPPTMSLSPGTPTAAAPALPPDKVVLTVGDTKVTVADFGHFMEMVPEQYRRQMATPAGRRQFADNIVRIKVMSSEAHKRGLDQTEAFKQQMAFQTEQILAQSLYKDLLATVKVDDASAKEYYEKHKSEYEQLKARAILIRFKGSSIPLRPNAKDLTDAEALAKAKEIREKLVAGGDFAKLAEAESDDVGSAKKGGELDPLSRGKMLPAFDQTAFAAKIGDISEPVKTQLGYYIIKVEEKHTKPIEEVRADIDRRLTPEMVQKTMEQLKTAANVVMDPDFFGPPLPPPGSKPTLGAAPAAPPKPATK